MILYTDNKIDSASVSASTGSVNYPASNIKNPLLSRIYKGDEQTEITIDAGGSPKNISQAYTNLIQDPTDLTTANWTETNCDMSDSGETINGFKLWKGVVNSGAATPLVQSKGFNIIDGSQYVYSFYIRKGVDNVVEVDLIGGGYDDQVTVTFPTQSVIVGNGSTLDKVIWVDSITAQIFVRTAVQSDSISADRSVRFRMGTTGGSIIGNYTLYSQPQITEGTTMYPFIDGAKSADVIDESFIMPDRFTFDMIVEPHFAYDTTINHWFLDWLNTTSNRFGVDYYAPSNQILVLWNQDGAISTLRSQVFDDGTLLTNINQRLRMVGSIDLVSGGQSDSRFIVIPLDEGDISEDTTWSVIPEIKNQQFNTLSIGCDRSGPDEQANSEVEYLRIYEGLLVGDVTSSDDVTELLKDKKILFDKTYQSKITATDLLIAGSTINDGDTVYLRGNDVDSFGSGTPLDETITWSKNIITHNFTKSTYQYYWLYVNSSNDIEIGRIFLGESIEPPGISPILSQSHSDSSTKTITPSRQTYGDIRKRYYNFDLSWPALTHAEKETLIQMFSEIGKVTPLFVTFDEDCLDLVTYYVTINSDFDYRLLANSDYYTAGLELLEEL